MAVTKEHVEREAAEALAAELAKPDAEIVDYIGCDEFFNPWSLFPCLYGSYSSDFDECALDVLREIQSGEKIRDDLGAEMFREMLCTANLCDYGTSPRVCFPTSHFEPLLPDLISRWEAYSNMSWGGHVDE